MNDDLLLKVLINNFWRSSDGKIYCNLGEDSPLESQATEAIVARHLNCLDGDYL